MSNIDIARRYLALLMDPASTAEQLDAVIAPEIIVEDAPNLVAPAGRRRDYQAIREGFALAATQRATAAAETVTNLGSSRPRPVRSRAGSGEDPHVR